MIIRLIKLLLFTIALISQSAWAAPKFPPPPDSTIGKPGESIVINGLPMDIRQFISRRSVDEVLEFYRNFWPKGTKKEPGYTETDALEPWFMITRVDDGYLMTVQVTFEGDNGSSGLLGMSRLPDPNNVPKLGIGFPKMRGSRVFNDILSKDIGKTGRTLQLTNHFSVENNANFYRNHFTNDGWSVDLDKIISGGDTQSLRFSNKDKSVSIVIHKSDKGSIVIAQTEN